MNRCIPTFLLFFISAYPIIIQASETNDSNDKLESIQHLNGQPVIFIDETMQEISGLKTLKVKEVRFNPEIIAYGKAISISPLLTIRYDYLSAVTQLNASRTRLTEAEKNISRSRNLHKSEIVSIKNLQQQQSQWQSDKAIYEKNVLQSQLIVNNSKLHWGETLTQWATDKHSPRFDKLLNGESTLLIISLPTGQSLPSDTSPIVANSTGSRNSAFKLSFICTLPQVDNFSKGLQYIFATDTPKIKPGMTVTAWVPQQKQHKTSIIIPESSLAWHLGQPFVFIRIDKDHFVHRNISQPIKTSNGYYVGEQIIEGEEVVMTGTQMLLSHEFRSQIPDEDDD